MFEPRPAMEFKSPISKQESKPYSGVAHLLKEFETSPPPERSHFEPPAERKRRIGDQLKKLNEEKNALMLSDWDPHSNPNATE